MGLPSAQPPSPTGASHRSNDIISIPLSQHSYFAYGSNLHKSVFEGRRRIKPAESVPAVLPGWKLTFAQPGLPYSEPCFAAVEPAAEVASSSSSNGSSLPDCHGALGMQ